MNVESLPYYSIALGFVLSSVALWFSLVFIRKESGKIAWALMLIGTVLITLTAWSVTTTILIEDLSRYGTKGSLFHWQSIERYVLRSTVTLAQASGLLLFAVGFLIHASRSSRKRNRITELEMMNRSLTEELEHLRNR